MDMAYDLSHLFAKIQRSNINECLECKCYKTDKGLVSPPNTHTNRASVVHSHFSSERCHIKKKKKKGYRYGSISCASLFSRKEEGRKEDGRKEGCSQLSQRPLVALPHEVSMCVGNHSVS